ncbi:MAG TPA: hypothetical protein VF123_06985 [Candidatus Sulfotelmatobacter sp.]
MSTEHKQEWMRLCELASKEQDPEKLMELVREITRLLEERETMIKAKKSTSESSALSN